MVWAGCLRAPMITGLESGKHPLHPTLLFMTAFEADLSSPQERAGFKGYMGSLKGRGGGHMGMWRVEDLGSIHSSKLTRKPCIAAHVKGQ